MLDDGLNEQGVFENAQVTVTHLQALLASVAGGGGGGGQLKLTRAGFESVALEIRGGHCHLLLLGFLLRKSAPTLLLCGKGNESLFQIHIKKCQSVLGQRWGHT